MAQKQAKMMKMCQLIFSIAIGVIWTTQKTHIQLMNPPKAWPFDLILVVVTSEG